MKELAVKNIHFVVWLKIVFAFFITTHIFQDVQADILPPDFTTQFFNFVEAERDFNELQLTFLTNTHNSKLHLNHYHILEASFTKNNGSSYEIHISKTEGLFHHQQLGLTPSQVQDLDCVFSGTIRETYYDDGKDPINGIVSFSSCHFESGFEGLILLPDEQYYIKPVINDFKINSNTKPTLIHKAWKVEGKRNGANQNFDSILIPTKEDFLNAERANKARNAKLQAYADNSNNFTGKNYDLNEEPLTNAKLRSSRFKIPHPLKLARGKGSQQQGSRKRRPNKIQTSSKSNSASNIVELAVFTDHKMFKVWKARYPQNTETKLRQVILAILNNMNALYKQPSMTEQISFQLVYLEIATGQVRSLNNHGGHSTKYLKAFCSYAAEKNQYGTMWDHALLLTGLDMHDGAGRNDTAGIAWFSTMCINGLSCSVIEGSTFGSTFVTSAHEIGHSLGMEHDGSKRNSNCNADSYIMSPTTGGGKTDWSTCSMKNLRQFLSKGYGGNAAPKCITKRGSRASNSIHFGNSKAPGQQFDANAQCSVECPGCKPYFGKTSPYNNICHLLFCQRKTSPMSYLIQSTHPALEATACSKGKTCKLGKCQ